MIDGFWFHVGQVMGELVLAFGVIVFALVIAGIVTFLQR